MEQKQQQQIKSFVEELYKSTPLDNKTDINSWVEEALKLCSKNNLSLEEAKKTIKETIERKKELSEIKSQYYEKFSLIERVAKSFGNVPLEHIEEILLKNKSILSSISSDKLVNICIGEFSQYRNYTVEIDHSLPKLIEKMLHSEKTRMLLTNILSNEKTLYIHSEHSIDGSYLSHNAMINKKAIDFLTKYLIIHKEEYEIDALYQDLMNADLNSMSSKELNNFFNTIILSSVQKRLGLEETETLESRQKIVEFIYGNYIENGYCFQGINGNYKNSVITNGLTSKFSRKEDSRLLIVDDIFKKHGLDKIFFSKLDETDISPYYYLTDKMETAYHFSYHNPEWFSYFCASGNNMPDHEYDRTSYYMRDKDSSRENLEKLCSNYHLSPQEQKYVLEFFNDSWEQLVGSYKENAVVFVQRKLINRNKIPLDLSTIKNKSALEIVEEILASNFDIDVQYDDIPKECIDVIDVPTISSFYDKSKLENLSPVRIIKLENGEKYSYDILIHADTEDIDCISIVDDTQPTLISKKNDQGKRIDIIQCPSNINQDSTIINGSPSFQTLEMLIAVNGIANSVAGQKLIDKARKDYPPSYMSEYYYHLSNFICDLALNTQLPEQSRAAILLRLAKDIYPKAELMKKTNNYPQYVDEDKKVFSYLNHKERLLLDKVKKIKGEEIKDNDSLINLAMLFKEKIKGKVNDSFTNEFNSKTENLRRILFHSTSDSKLDNTKSQNVSSLQPNTNTQPKK